jgi:hypothetical protein
MHSDHAAASRSLRAALAKAEELDETYLIFRAALGSAVVAADECDVAGARSLLDQSLRRAL